MPTDQTLRLGSLCSGYGGLDLAAEHLLGPLQHTWHAEIDPHASKVLAHHWPTTPNLGDLTAVDWTRVPQVDVLTAGFPCQDVSCAGKRAGMVADRVIPAGIMDCGCPWADHRAETCEDDSYPNGGSPAHRYEYDGASYAQPAVVWLNNRDRGVIPAGEMACGCQWGDHQVDVCDAASPSGMVPSRLFARGDLVAAAAAVAELNTRDRASAGPPPERVIKGTRTGIWSYVADAIKHLRPKLVLLENVRGLLSARADSDVEPCPWCVGDDRTEPVVRALGAVLADLAALGFDAEWVTVPASDVGAPHRRERVFIAAWPADADSLGREAGNFVHTGARASLGQDAARGAAGAPGVTLLPTPAAARSGRQKSASAGAAIRPSLDSIGKLLPTPAARDWRSGESNIMDRNARPLNEVVVNLLPTPTVADSRGSRNATAGRTAIKPTTSLGWTLSDIAYAGALLPTPMAADGGSDRASSAGFGLRDTSRKIPDQWGPYAPAIARWETITGRPAPSPTEPGAKGQPRLAPPFVEWLMGLPAGWVTGHLGRGQALKCLGNGVVWQQAAHAYTQLLATA